MKLLINNGKIYAEPKKVHELQKILGKIAKYLTKKHNADVNLAEFDVSADLEIKKLSYSIEEGKVEEVEGKNLEEVILYSGIGLKGEREKEKTEEAKYEKVDEVFGISIIEAKTQDGETYKGFDSRESNSEMFIETFIQFVIHKNANRLVGKKANNPRIHMRSFEKKKKTVYLFFGGFEFKDILTISKDELNDLYDEYISKFRTMDEDNILILKIIAKTNLEKAESAKKFIYEQAALDMLGLENQLEEIVNQYVSSVDDDAKNESLSNADIAELINTIDSFDISKAEKILLKQEILILKPKERKKLLKNGFTKEDIDTLIS